MKLGIKYCGGCNPHYDRTGMVRRLLTDLPEIDPVYDTAEYCPVWIDVCGCANLCVKNGSLRAGRVITVSSAKDLLPLREELKRILSDHRSSDKQILRVGMTASRVRIFTEKDLLAFAALSEDTNGIHLDPAVADLTIFRKPIVHGVFVATLFSAILGTQLPGSGTILMQEEMQYLAPVFPGDHITAEIRFASCAERASAYIGEFEGSCKNDDGIEVIRGRFRELMPKRLFSVEAGE